MSLPEYILIGSNKVDLDRFDEIFKDFWIVRDELFGNVVCDSVG